MTKRYISRGNLLELQKQFLTKDSCVRATLALMNNLLPEVQYLLTEDPLPMVRQHLAENTNLIPEVQQILVKDSDEWVRAYLAKNHNLIPELQEILVKDLDENVRMYLARNPNLIPKLQEILAKDSEEDVRRFLATNPNLISEVKDILLKDFNRDVKNNLDLGILNEISFYEIEEKSSSSFPLAILSAVGLVKILTLPKEEPREKEKNTKELFASSKLKA